MAPFANMARMSRRISYWILLHDLFPHFSFNPDGPLLPELLCQCIQETDAVLFRDIVEVWVLAESLDAVVDGVVGEGVACGVGWLHCQEKFSRLGLIGSELFNG